MGNTGYLIQASTKNEAVAVAKENGLAPFDWAYLRSVDQVRGLRGSGVKVIKVGPYWLGNPRVAEEIDHAILSQELQVEYQHT